MDPLPLLLGSFGGSGDLTIIPHHVRRSYPTLLYGLIHVLSLQLEEILLPNHLIGVFIYAGKGQAITHSVDFEERS